MAGVLANKHQEPQAPILSVPNTAVLCWGCTWRFKQLDCDLQNSSEPQDPKFFQVTPQQREVNSRYYTPRRTWLLQKTHRLQPEPGCLERSVNRRPLCQVLPLESPAVAAGLVKTGREGIATELL